MLTSGVVRRVELPHEPGQWVEVRQLSGSQLERAREARSLRAIEIARAMGPELLGAQISTEDRAAAVAVRDPLNDYDRTMLLLAGITAWSYQEPVSPDSIADLDDETMELIARELLPPDRSEAARKNGSGPSTSSSKVTKTA